MGPRGAPSIAPRAGNSPAARPLDFSAQRSRAGDDVEVSHGSSSCALRGFGCAQGYGCGLASGICRTRAVKREDRTFRTTTSELLNLSEWVAAEGCTHVAMEATAVYWKPVWYILSDGDVELILANAAHVKNVPGLAELLAHGLFRGSFVRDTPTQELRGLLRSRKQRFASEAGRLSGCKRRWRRPTSSSLR